MHFLEFFTAAWSRPSEGLIAKHLKKGNRLRLFGGSLLASPMVQPARLRRLLQRRVQADSRRASLRTQQIANRL
jgi:hypothetical protein